jgi:hypothetical protein
VSYVTENIVRGKRIDFDPNEITPCALAEQSPLAILVPTAMVNEFTKCHWIDGAWRVIRYSQNSQGLSVRWYFTVTDVSTS